MVNVILCVSLIESWYIYIESMEKKSRIVDLYVITGDFLLNESYKLSLNFYELHIGTKGKKKKKKTEPLLTKINLLSRLTRRIIPHRVIILHCSASDER